MSLKDLRKNYAGVNSSVTQTDVDHVMRLFDKPRNWQHRYSQERSRVRQWLMQYLNLSSSELDNVLLGYFVRAHRDEIEVAEPPTPTWLKAAE